MAEAYCRVTCLPNQDSGLKSSPFLEPDLAVKTMASYPSITAAISATDPSRLSRMARTPIDSKKAHCPTTS